MSSATDSEMSRSVTEGEVTVRKTFEAEEFPVPAVKFVVESTASEPVHLRLVDPIPDSLPMENVGFHPDFEKDNWTAYKTHRVEYNRTLDPGESTTTVYGIRLDDTDPAEFMTSPVLSLLDSDETGPPDQAIDDVLGEDSNQLVRDVLSGERESLPGLDDGVDAPDLTTETTSGTQTEDLELDLDFDDESEEEDDPQPQSFDGTGASATEQPANVVLDAVDEAGDGPAAATEPTSVEDGVSEDLELDITQTRDADGADDRDRAEADTASGGVVAALTAEIQRGDVDDADVAALREALGVDDRSPVEIPRSLDLRIQRLQSQVEDLAAYSAGLEEFLDEEGTAEELIEEFRTDVQATSDEIETLFDRTDAADDDRSQLRDDVDELRREVSDVGDQLDAVDSRLAEVTERLDAVDETTESLDEEVDEVRDELATLDGDVTDARESLDEELGDVRERLDAEFEELRDDHSESVDTVRDEVAALQSELDSLNNTVDDFRTFRDRLSNALGPMVGSPESGSADTDQSADDESDDE